MEFNTTQSYYIFQIRTEKVTTQSQPTPQCEGVHRIQLASQVMIITFICYNQIAYVVSTRLFLLD